MKRFALAAIVVVCSCGGQSEPVIHDVPAAKLPDASLSEPIAAIRPLGLPHDAAFVASFDSSTAIGLGGKVVSEIERELGIPPGALASGAQIGLDTSRPIAFALPMLDDAQRRLVDELRAVATSSTSGPSDATNAVMRAANVTLSMRLLVPSTDTAKLEAFIGAALDKMDFHKTKRGFTKHAMTVAISEDASSVTIDVTQARSAHDAEASFEALANSGHDAPLALDGKAFRATWSPTALAGYSFLTGLVAVAGAISGASIDPSQRERIAHAGLVEASEAFTLAGSPPAFERIDVEARAAPFELVVRAKTGASFVMPPDSVWAPSTSAALEGASASAESTRELTTAFPSPKPDVLQLLRDSGSFGWAVGLSYALVALPNAMSRPSRFAAVEDVVRGRFERTGMFVSTQNTEAFVGLLDAKASRANAECIFSPPGKCPATAKLKLGGVVTKDGRSVRLVEVDHRFVVIASRDEAFVKSKVTTRSVGPLHADVATAELVRVLAPTLALPARIVGDVSHENGAILFRFVSP